jgi:Fe-S cluster assembly protein SufD
MVDTAAATDVFTAAFPAFLAARAGSEPAWLTTARQNAFAAFTERGFPTARVEAWRYTRVKAISEGRFALPGTAALPAAETLAPHAIATEQPLRAVLVDGRLCRQRSMLDALPRGVVVKSLFDALAAGDAAARASLEASCPEDHSFAALNAAFLEDGLLVVVEPGVVLERPLEIVSLTQGGVAAQVRIVVVLGATAQATLTEIHAALPGSAQASFTNVVVDVKLEDGARLTRVKVAEDAVDASHVALLRAEQGGRDSTLDNTSLTFGGALVRDSIRVRLAGQGASCRLDGLYHVAGSRNHDHYTVIDHAVPNTTSLEHYKGVLDDDSRGTFFGRILVREGARGTSSRQVNHNLLLSDRSLCNSTPQLEILNDDVKCSHGSTIGQIDATALFYLRSRGLSESAAREMLTYAFANEILDRLTIEPLRERLAGKLVTEPPPEHLEHE